VTPDLVAELLRQLMKEAMILTAPVLITAVVLGFVLTLAQTLTSLQEQSLTSVPRLGAVALILLVGMPWFLGRVSAYAVRLISDLHRYLG
jgi:flagellar biosynthetic protein FliQ